MNRIQNVSYRNISFIQQTFPTLSLSQAFSLAKYLQEHDLTIINELFPTISSDNLLALLKSRAFIHWFSKYSSKLLLCIPLVAQQFPCLLAQNTAAQFFIHDTPSQVVLAASEEIPLPKVFTDETSGGLLAGKGYIILQILVVGFLSLVVSTFLKFTGRGDLIPILTFISGSVILYECMGLFWSIYEGIKYFLFN